MHLLALFLICWIAAGCLITGFVADLSRDSYHTVMRDIPRLNGEVDGLGESVSDIYKANSQRLKRIERLEESVRIDRKELDELDAETAELQERFEAHRTSLNAHKALPKRRR